MIKIPIYIPVFNNPTYTENFLNQLSEYKFENIFIVDNNSDYPEMLKLFRKIENKVNIIRMQENKGPHYILRNNSFYEKLPDLFILSDPDLELSKKMEENFVNKFVELSRKFEIGKVGFAHEIPHISELKRTNMYLDGKNWNIIDWEKQFWDECLGETEDGDRIYLANLDTQFALYNKEYFDPMDRYRAIRVAGKYTAKHLGLYKDSIVPLKEKLYYENSTKYSYFDGKLNANLEPVMELSVLEYTHLIEERDSLRKDIEILDEKSRLLNGQIQQIYNSRSWKMLSILRKLRKGFTK